MPDLMIDGRSVEVLPLSDAWTSMEQIDHKYLTCRNHPTALYLTKNPFSRNLHFIRRCDEWFGTSDDTSRWTPLGECKCPFDDLVVLPDGDPRREPSKQERQNRWEAEHREAAQELRKELGI